MPQEDAEAKLRSSTAGYYSYREGARYLSPFASKSKFPMLVELHESQHEYLAHGNATDAMARLYTGVLEWGEGHLRADHQREINELLQTIHRNIVYTHELVATYLSMLLFWSRRPEDVSSARAELDGSYRKILLAAETAFGEINDPRLDASMITATLACAVAVLNPPFPLEIVRFQRLSECRRFVEKNSPDRRMRWLLKRLRPAWQRESIFKGLQDLKNSAEVQATVWSNLRSRFPKVEFVTDRPTILREWVTILKEDARTYSYEFLADKDVQPNPEGLSEKLGATFEHSEVNDGDDDSLDLSVSSTGYVFGSFEELTTIAEASAREGSLLHCHTIVALPLNRAEFKCFALNRGGKHAVLPIGMEVAFDELVKTLVALPRGSLAIKIDELWALKTNEGSSLSVATMLAATGHPVFVLVNDSHPRNLRRLLLSSIEEQQASLCPMVGEDGYGFSLIYLHRDRYAILSPVSELGLEVLFHEFEDNAAVVFAQTDDVLPVMGLSEAAIKSLITACFIKGPPRFDFKKIDSAELFQGIYDEKVPRRPWWQSWRT
jgi:hypothetical protein